MTFLDDVFEPPIYTSAQLAQIQHDNRQELEEAYRILEEQDYDQRSHCADTKLQHNTYHDVSQYTPKKHRYTVRFQVIKLYSVVVTAVNASDADNKAMQFFKQCPQNATLVNTSIGHTTIEQLQGGA